jgi:DHA1 family tetracycline resistance protein-like MFS transporter
MFLATFAFAGMEATFALLGQRQFGLDQRGFGLIFTLIGAISIGVQGVLVRRLHLRAGERALAMWGALLMGAGLLAIPLAHDAMLAVLFLSVLAVGQGLVSPSLVSLLSRESDVWQQGSTLGVGQAGSAAARAAGPLVTGALFDVRPSVAYLACGILVLAGAWIVSRARREGVFPLPQDKLAG